MLPQNKCYTSQKKDSLVGIFGIQMMTKRFAVKEMWGLDDKVGFYNV